MIALLTGVKSSKKSYYTELKSTVDKLQKKNMQLEIINEVMKSIKVDMSVNEILQSVNGKLRDLMRCDRLSLYLLENNKLILSNVYPCDQKDLQPGFTLENHQSLYWTALMNQQIIKEEVNQQSASFFEKDYLHKLQMNSVVVLPLFVKSKRIGVLSISRQDDTEWNMEDLLFLEQLTGHLAISLENAQLYKEVVHRKQHWEDTFKAVADMIILYDSHLQVLQYNDSVRSFFKLDGCSPTFSELGEQCKNIIEATFRFKRPGSQDIYLKNSSICEAYTFPVHNTRQKVYGVILILKDVTEKRKMEAQLLHSGKLAAIGEMAAGIAHELNSPLTAILGNSQLLLRNPTYDDTSRLLLNDIKKCGDRCKNIIKSLLTFSRQDEYVFETFSLNEAVKQVFQLFKYQFEKNEIRIFFELDENLPLMEGSQQQIEQIIVNLILNARDALETSKKATKEINIKTSFNKSEVLLMVRDNGIGIEEERISEIFHPFYTTKAEEKGTGLGLSVSLGIAKAHVGTIEVESLFQSGSMFTLRLPFQPSLMQGDDGDKFIDCG